jgi:CRP-like cAMP-binding protein
MQVERDGERLAEYGPGALLGERSHLERGVLTSTLVVVTPCRVAAVAAAQLDRSTLKELSGGQRREDLDRGLTMCGSGSAVPRGRLRRLAWTSFSHPLRFPAHDERLQ